MSAPHIHKTVFDHRTIRVCDFDQASSRILPLFETRVLPVALPGDKIVLTLGRDFPAELPLLRRLGFGPNDEDLLFIATDLSGADDLPIERESTIYPFSATSPLSHGLRQSVGCGFHGCHQRVAVAANLKSTLQRWGDERIPVPEGFCVRDSEELAERMMEMHQRHDAVVFKPDFSASGIGHRTFRRGEQVDELDSLMFPGIVQAHVPKTMDVSVQFRVDPVTDNADGPHEGPHINILEMTGQYVSEHGEYMGGFFPVQGLLKETKDRIKEAVWHAVSRVVYQEGYWGPGSVDVLVNTQTRQFWLVDLNARVSAMWYPLEMIRRRLGHVLPFSMRSFQIPVGMAISDLEELFKAHLFSWVNKKGFVPFAFLPEVGFCYGVVFAEDPERCQELDRIIEQIKQSLQIAS